MKCNLCNEEFVFLKRHMKTCLRSIHGESNQDKMFPCDLCEEKFVYRENLQLHVKVVHKKTGKKKYICELCKHEFNSNSNLNEHKKNRHHEEKREKCKICDKEIKAGPSMKLSTSIYDLMLLYVCHFHHHLPTFWQFMDYRDTRAFILDPCIQEF